MLYIVATPIGNLDDFSLRGIEALRTADVLACEDTRRTRVLLSHFEIPRPGVVLSYRDGIEHKAAARLAGYLRDGLAVALCSDGGYPGISDPGYRIIRLAAQEGFEMEVIPGPSAVPVALLLSGLSTASYCFKGYPPRKEGALRRFIQEDGGVPHTLVFFESPMRVIKTLSAAFDVLGDREAAVCIELTKKFERVERGYLSELINRLTDRPIKGEVTLVIAGNNPKFHRPEQDANATPLDTASELTPEGRRDNY